MFCWLLLPEIKELLFFNFSLIQENKETDSIANQTFGDINIRCYARGKVFRILIPSALTTGVGGTQYDLDNYMIPNAMWNKISYHLGLSNAKRLIIIPQLRFYNSRFCLMGKGEEFEDSLTKATCNYPALNKFIISVSPSFADLSYRNENTIINTKSAEYPNANFALLIANPEENLPSGNEEANVVINCLNKVKYLMIRQLHSATKATVLQSLLKTVLSSISLLMEF